MMTQTKISIEKEYYDFIKDTHKKLNYRSLSEYVRDAIRAKVKIDRKKIREKKRQSAMEMIGEKPHQNLFENLEGEDFENC